jgi:hypothetical protein
MAEPKAMTPEVEALGPITPNGEINWDWVGSKGRTLREWHDKSVGSYLERAGDTEENRAWGEEQFHQAVARGLII